MDKPSSTRNAIQDMLPERLWDWRIALLTLALVEISSTRLVITKWVPFLYFTQTIVFFGTIAGLALGYSYFSRKAVVRIAAGYTLIMVPAQLLKAIEKTDWLWQDILVLFSRLMISLGQFVKGQPVYDQLFFISLVTFGYWVIGLCAGYWLTRHKDFLSVILPSGLVMLIIQIFDPSVTIRVWGLAFYIFIALLLLGRMYFLENRSFWKKSHFLLTPETVGDLEWGALTVAAIAVFISWSLPGWISSVKPAARAWNRFSQPLFDRLSDAVSALESPYGKGPSGDFYSNELSLGQQAATGDTQVFYVEVKENDFVPVRNYWKGRVYDLYINGRWTTLSNTSEEFYPNVDELSVEYPEVRHEMEFTFTNNTPSQSLLYMPAETIWANRAGAITSTPISANVKDVTAWFATPGLLSGNKYQVRALIADPSIEELRLAGTEYPEWIIDRYLQIPENIEPQLSELAIEITAPYDTVYDKVEAVTTYLREEIQYETKITVNPPKNKDPLLWVLFDYKKGFCMYYASAETLMLRSIGIPARMAVGFAQGTVSEGNFQETYTVTYEDSHAWPEVYFPGIGWVEFEPTGNQAPLERPETKNNSAEEAPTPNSGENIAENPIEIPVLQTGLELLTNAGSGASPITSQSILFLYGRLLSYTLAVLLFGLGIFITRRCSFENRLPVYLASRYIQSGNTPPRWLDRWVRWAHLTPMERAFQAINISLYWLGHPQPIYVTSQERADILVTHLPTSQDQILLLLQEYQTTLYTPRAGNITSARKAATIILLKTWQTQMKKALQFLDTRYNQIQ